MDAAPFLMMLILSAAAVKGLLAEVASEKLMSVKLFSNPVSVSNTAIFENILYVVIWPSKQLSLPSLGWQHD